MLTNTIKSFLRPAKHSLERILSKRPMQAVFKKLESKGENLSGYQHLELFGGVGDIHLVDVSKLVKSSVIWEYNPEFVSKLKSRFPQAEVECVDTYARISEERRVFDLVISDNPIQTEGGHVEHFDLFPHVFNLVNKNGILVISILPEINELQIAKFPEMADQQQLDAREEFYKSQDATSINPDEFYNAFKRLSAEAGRSLDWWFIEKRNDVLSYFVCKVGETANS